MPATEGDRECSVCGGSLSVRNTSGICARTFECRSAQQKRRKNRPYPSEPSGAALQLEPAYEIDEAGNKILDDDGMPIEIVDEVTVRILVSGVRRVAYTERERDLAVQRMISYSYRFREIAANMGTSPEKLRPVIEALGYELIPRRQAGGKGLREATEIRKIRATTGLAH